MAQAKDASIGVGGVVDRELTRLNKAAGMLCYMVIKKRLSRSGLIEVVGTLEDITQKLKEVINGKASNNP